jgi:hypothetical protein
MKCKVFIGSWNQAVDAFNVWAKGKALSRDVIIHTQTYVIYKAGEYREHMTITVYHPEGEHWEQTNKWEAALQEKTIKPTGTYEKAITQ